MEARRVQILLCAASASSFLAIALYYFFSPVSPLLPSLKPVLLHLVYRLRDIFAFLAFTAAIAIAIFTTQKKPGKEEAALGKASLASVTAFHHLTSIFGDFQEDEEEREDEKGSGFISGGKLQSPGRSPRNGFYLAAEKRQITRRSCDDSGSITTSSSKISQRKASLLHRKTSSFDEYLNSNSPSNVAAGLESRQTLIDTKVSFAASESVARNSSLANDVKSEDEKVDCNADVSSSPFKDDSFLIHSRTRMSVFDANDVDDGMVGSDVDSSPALERTRQTFSIQSDQDQMEYDESLLTSPNEINRQADAFIARVNEQMRLQMLASIERQRKKDHSK